MRKLTYLLLSFCFMLTTVLAQETRTVSGTVKDASGTPIAGASVQVKGTTLGTTTDARGTFTLRGVPASAKTLVISSLNFERQEVSIAGKNSVDVSLTASATDIDEVVVTGFGKAKKNQYSGTVTKVSEKDIKNVPVGSFEQVLQGRVPGLTVLSGSGQPGNSANVILRGPTSIRSGSTPLYIVDGVPVEASVFQSINPNDFESIDILKDGISQAQYGNRGAAGVIVVTTKRGAAGKARLSYSNQTGMRLRPQFNYRMMNAAELLAAQERLGTVLPGSAANLPGWQNSRLNPANASLTPAQLAQLDRNLDSLRAINTDWDDIYFRNGKFQNHEISLSGSVGKARIFSNIAYYLEEGIITRSDMKRVTMRNNFDYADERLTFRVTSLLGYTRRNFQESTTSNSLQNPFLVTRITPGYLSLYKTDGTFNTNVAQPYYGINLYEAMLYNKNYNDQIKITVGTEAAYKISNSLSAGLQTSADFRETNNTFYSDPRTFINQISTSVLVRSGTYQEGMARTFQTSVRPFVTYKRVFKKVHDVEVSAYGEYLRTFNKSFTTTARGTDPKRPNTPAATTPGTVTNQLIPTFGGGKSERANLSAFTVARYTYNNKYTINATLRRDGTSVLPEKNRWATFTGIGGVWEISKEGFLKGVKNINSLRLKASWGQSANLENFALGYFGYLPNYGLGQYEGLITNVNTSAGNPDADWEYTNTTNISLEFSAFKNRLTGELTYYDKTTKGLYAPNQLSIIGSGLGLGGSVIDVNAGSMYNRGFEYILGYDVIRNRNATLNLFVNGAINTNKITDLGTATEFAQGTGLIRVGHSIGDHYEVKWAGVDQATGQPLYYDKDGKVTADFTKAFRTLDHGSWIPRYTGGFGANLTLNNFEFSTLFSYAAGTKRVNNLEFFVENPSFLAGGFNQAASLNFWTKPGDVASTQSPAFQNQFSSKYIQDASFLRLRNVTIAYNLPKSAISKLKFVSRVRFYVQGQNLATFTKWKGYDPEDDNNISLSEFPNPRSLTGGLEITF